jgi:MFS family permease
MVVTRTGRIIGSIIGIILGIGFILAPVIGNARQEASMADPNTRMIVYGLAMIGVFMVIAGIVQLVRKPGAENQPEAKAFAKNSWALVMGAILFISGRPEFMSMVNSPLLNYNPGLRTIAGIAFFVGFFIMLMIDISNERQAAARTTTTTTPAKAASKEEPETEEKKIKCRFCGKKYSADYNGCPHCKKK